MNNDYKRILKAYNIEFLSQKLYSYLQPIYHGVAAAVEAKQEIQAIVEGVYNNFRKNLEHNFAKSEIKYIRKITKAEFLTLLEQGVASIQENRENSKIILLTPQNIQIIHKNIQLIYFRLAQLLDEARIDIKNENDWKKIDNARLAGAIYFFKQIEKTTELESKIYRIQKEIYQIFSREMFIKIIEDKIEILKQSSINYCK